MSEAVERILVRPVAAKEFVRPLGIFAPWRLYAYGLIFPVVYSLMLLSLYIQDRWFIDSNGVPVYTDFTNIFAAGLQALHQEVASIYVPAEYLKLQDTLVGAGRAFHSTWPYPSTFFLILAPLAMLPYGTAFVTWNVVTILGYLLVVYLIVRRRPAIVLVLASPFTIWNIVVGQTGFLTASLLGASLLFLERRPALAGVFIGCLTYKPQFGMLLPVALVAARQWRAFASAAATVLLLTGVSVAAFGIGPWEAFPRELVAQASLNLSADRNLILPQLEPRDYWGDIETMYGMIRTFGGGAPLAWIAQGLLILGSAVLVWLVWGSPVRYSLKAATLSVAALIATPYAHAYDLAAIAIPVAFLARDQIRFGLLSGEQTAMLALFSICLASNTGRAPLGSIVTIALLCVILRRDLSWWGARRLHCSSPA